LAYIVLGALSFEEVADQGGVELHDGGIPLHAAAGVVILGMIAFSEPFLQVGAGRTEVRIFWKMAGWYNLKSIAVN
jgi:hypothetical protein